MKKKKPRNTLKTLLSIIFLFIVVGSNAQSLNLSFNHLTRENGLSNNNATSLLADSKGFLWIGTHNGLNRFDGSNCTTFKPYNSSIKGVSIINIIEDKNSDLWFITEFGLNRYVRKTNQFELVDCFKDGKSYQIIPFYIDNKNRLWISVIGKGIFTYNPVNKTTQFISKEYSANLKVSRETFKAVERIVFSDDQSGLTVLKLKDDKVEGKASYFNGKKEPYIHINRYFFIENDSLIWVTGSKHGLTKLNYKNGTSKTFEDFQQRKLPVLTTVAFRPNSTQIFVGSNELGILIFDSKSQKFIQQLQHSSTNPKSLKANWTEDIVIDKNQNLFTIQMGWGVDFCNLGASITQHWFSREEALSQQLNDNVVAYSFIHKNKIFLKLQQGKVFILDTNGKIIEQIKDYSMAENMVYGTDSTLYACGLGEVLILNDDFRVKQRIPIINKNGSPEYVTSIAFVTPNELMVGTRTGLFEVTQQGNQHAVRPIEELKKFNFSIHLPLHFDQATQQLFFAENWWSNFHVLKKKQGIWEVQNLKKLEANVFNIVADATDKHTIWLCTNKGLWKFDTKTYQYEIWDEAKGLPDNSVTTYIPEKNGDFWLITNRGISFFNKKLNKFKNFSEKDGATSSEYDWYGNFRLPDGKMIFSGTDGITIIDPKQVNASTTTHLYFTDVKINEKSLLTDIFIGETSDIRLKPNQNSFSIDFVGIDYANPENIKLQYQLQNFDNQWIASKNPATVYFSNIPEGDYILRVRTLSDNGEISTEKTLKIVVDAPFWRTTWFRIILLLLLLGLIYAFYRYRINQLLRLQEVRNRISTDLHDEIGATLSGIGILSTIAKQQIAENHPAHPLLERISDDTLTVGNSIDDIVWSINPKNDEMGNIVARMRRYAADLFDAKHIDYQINTPSDIEHIKLSMEQRRDVYLIFKEAINNLLKYSNCTKAVIEIDIKNRQFSLFISDNGVGFDPQKSTFRNGLKNMTSRAAKLKGKLKIDSDAGEGTRILLTFMV